MTNYKEVCKIVTESKKFRETPFVPDYPNMTIESLESEIPWLIGFRLELWAKQQLLFENWGIMDSTWNILTNNLVDALIWRQHGIENKLYEMKKKAGAT